MSFDSTNLTSDSQPEVEGIPTRQVESYRLEGITPRQALVPRTVEELGTCLRSACEAGAAVVPWGGGTQMGLGNLLEAADLVVDVRGINRLVEYEADDLTVAVEAGCTLAELNRRLGQHGQMLPVDAAEPESATIGGLVASGISGPRRHGYGSLRDLIIGITAVLPDGTIGKGGGMVVKNVSGFDMMRLYHGSLGALAIITQVNFKLLPRPRAQRTVIARYAALESAAAAAEQVRLSQLGPTAIVLLDGDAATRAGLSPEPWTLLLRCEAPPVAVLRQAERISAVVATDASGCEAVDEDETEQLWSRVAQAMSASPGASDIGVRIGCPPSGLASTAQEVASICRAADVPVAQTLDYGSGLIYARVTPEAPGGDDAASSIATLRGVWDQFSALGSHAALLTAPEALKRGIDVFGREPAGFAIMRALKEQFDPRRTLNRGRFVGHL